MKIVGFEYIALQLNEELKQCNVKIRQLSDLHTECPLHAFHLALWARRPYIDLQVADRVTWTTTNAGKGHPTPVLSLGSIFAILSYYNPRQLSVMFLL